MMQVGTSAKRTSKEMDKMACQDLDARETGWPGYGKMRS